MATKKPKVGDPVLFYGNDLEITAVEGGVVVVEDTAGQEERAAAVERERELRGRPWAHLKKDPEKLGAYWAEVNAAAQAARELLIRFRLRADLLSWWEERGVWVSDGRILSDAQQERFQKITGSKVRPDGQRAALELLTAQEA